MLGGADAGGFGPSVLPFPHVRTEPQVGFEPGSYTHLPLPTHRDVAVLHVCG